MDFKIVPLINQTTFDELIRMTSNDKSLLTDLFKNFFLDIDSMLVDLHDGYGEKNLQKQIKSIHTIKGLCGTIGASQLAEVAKTLEDEIKNQNFSRYQELLGSFFEIYDETKNLINSLVLSV